VAANGDADLRVRLLGRFEVETGGEPIPSERWPRQKTKDLLKLLLTEPGAAFTVDQIIEALFPDADPERATRNVQARISELRRVLEPGLTKGSNSRYIRHVGEGYMLTLSPSVWIDTTAFAERLEGARTLADAGDWIPAIEAFENAIALCRGDFLAEDRYEDWASARREQLREQLVRSLTRLATCYAELGRMRQAISCCQRALDDEPHQETVAAQLMAYYVETGERGRALGVYEAISEHLQDSLGVEPSSDLVRLRESIVKRSTTPEPAAYNPLRVAVIPLVAVGADPSSEEAADGLTEELIYTLANVAGLEVIAQTSSLKYKGAGKSVAEIGSELRVGSLLEGSVQRVQDRIRVLIQLIDVEKETHLWAEQYDRDFEDVLQVQADIAKHTASALEVQLLPREKRVLEGDASLPSEVQDAYIEARRLLHMRTAESLRGAIAEFESVLAVAPRHTRSMIGLAEAYVALADFESAGTSYEKALRHIDAILSISPDHADAHALRGRILFWLEGDARLAEQEFQKAIASNPNCARAHAQYAYLLADTGRLSAACERGRTAVALDPLSAPLVHSYAESLHQAGRLAEAVEQYRRVIELDPALEAGWWGLWYALAGAWDWDRAEEVTRQIVADFPDHPFAYVNLATCVMCRGRLEEGILEIRKALDLTNEEKRTTILFHAGACHYFGREYEKAIGFLREVLERNPRWIPAHNMIAKCLFQLERYGEALTELDAAEKTFGGALPFWQTHIHMDRGRIYARTGHLDKAEEELKTLMENPGRQNYRIAVSGILSALGRMEEAMDWLEAAATAREPHVAAFRKAPDVDDRMTHPRFQALLKRIGLAD